MPDKDSADIEIAFPLVNFAIGTGGDKDAKSMVNALTRETWSPFNGCENWQPFIFCATYGYAKKRVGFHLQEVVQCLHQPLRMKLEI